jgi:hypothetical protein
VDDTPCSAARDAHACRIGYANSCAIRFHAV